jgi:ferrous iron transport protein B
MYDLREALMNAQLPRVPFTYSGEVERIVADMEAHLPADVPYRRKAAVLILMDDPQLLGIEFGEDSTAFTLTAEQILTIHKEREALLSSYKGQIQTGITKQLARWTDDIYERIVTVHDTRREYDLAGRMAYYSRHPVYGLLFLGVFLGVAYLGVVELAGWLAGLMETAITDPTVKLLSHYLRSPFWRDFLIGDFGILTLGLLNAICTVLPILSVFFFLFGLLEDIGYLPNLSVLLRRSFTKIGLSGRAVMPIVLGFGCKTMATLTTRSLRSRKERLISIYLIAFAIPCSAQLALNIAILGKAGVIPFLISLVFLVLVEILAGKILNLIIKDDGSTFFIQELPPFRFPVLKAVLKKTGYRLWWFLKEAIPVFVIAAAVIFTLDYIGVLDLLKQLLKPIVVSWMGLPIEMVEALILLIAREEAAAGLILRLSNMGMLNAVQSIIAVVVTTMFVPCFANIVAMFKEAGVKVGILMLIGINVSTILLAGMLNWALLAVQRIF